MTTLQQLANNLYNDLETATRHDGTEFIRVKETASETNAELIKSMVFDAIEGSFNFDTGYNFVRDTLSYLGDDYRKDYNYEQMQDDIYSITGDEDNPSLIKWLSDSLYNMAYVDEVLQENNYTSLAQALQDGQVKQRQEVAQVVLDKMAEFIKEQS